MADQILKTDGELAEIDDLYPAPEVVVVRVRAAAGKAQEHAEWREARIIVEEMSIIQLARLAQALGPVVNSIRPGMNLMLLAAEHPVEIHAAVAMAIGWQPDDLATMDGPGFFKVATAAFRVNGGLFRPPPRPPRIRLPGDTEERKSRRWSWADSLAYLRCRGHKDPEHYTIRQFQSAIVSADRIDREDRIARLMDMRVAFHGDAEAFAKHVKELQSPQMAELARAQRATAQKPTPDHL